MIDPFRLKGTFGANYSVDGDDIFRTKKALNLLGHFDEEEFINPYADRRMIKGLKSFQRSRGLRPDGIMKPDGPTAKELGKAIASHDRSKEIQVAMASEQRNDLLDLQAPLEGRNETNNSTAENTQVALAPAVAIPPIVIQIANYFSIAVSIALAWWNSMSDAEKDSIKDTVSGAEDTTKSDNLERCEYMLEEVDRPICDKIAERRGKAAAARCNATAMNRFAACLRGKPLPPLDTWNN